MSESIPWREIVELCDENLPHAILQGLMERDLFDSYVLADLLGMQRGIVYGMVVGLKPIPQSVAVRLVEIFDTDVSLFLLEVDKDDKIKK